MDFFWPSITNTHEAMEAAKRAAVFVFLVAGVTGLIAISSIVTGSPILGIGRFALVDAAIFAVVGWRLLRFSLPWAIAGLLLYLLEVVDKIAKGGSPGFLGIFIILALVAGIRGTAYLRKVEKEPAEPIVEDTGAATWER